jgi:hypothetical protein
MQSQWTISTNYFWLSTSTVYHDTDLRNGLEHSNLKYLWLLPFYLIYTTRNNDKRIELMKDLHIIHFKRKTSEIFDRWLHCIVQFDKNRLVQTNRHESLYIDEQLYVKCWKRMVMHGSIYIIFVVVVIVTTDHDRRSVDHCLGVGHRFGAHEQILIFILSDDCLILDVGRPLWQENGSVICGAIISGTSGKGWIHIFTLLWDSPTWRARSPYFYHPGTEWSSYNLGQCVVFSSPLKSHRAMVEVF